MMMPKHPLLQVIPRENLEEIQNKSISIDLKKGETLFLQEDLASYIYYVAVGTLKILKTSPTGQEKIFSIYQRRQFLALGVLFNAPYRYPATAIATEKTVVQAIPITELEKGIVASEDASRFWFGHLNRRLEKVQELLSDEVFIEAKDKFKKVLKSFARLSDCIEGDWVPIKISLTQQEMAELLSIRRETYSRLLTDIKENGDLEIGPKKQLQVRKKWLGL